jgi:hypothetical protein
MDCSFAVAGTALKDSRDTKGLDSNLENEG